VMFSTTYSESAYPNNCGKCELCIGESKLSKNQEVSLCNTPVESFYSCNLLRIVIREASPHFHDVRL